MDNINQKYPIINENFELLKFPNYGILKKKKTVSLERKEALSVINKDAMLILSMCNGQRSVNEIINRISKGNNKREIYKIKKFLITANKKGHLNFSNFPIKNVPVNIKGTTEFFIPSHLVIEITDSCNLNCSHCYRLKWNRKVFHFMELQKTEILLENLSKENVVAIEITGGEPTMHPKFNKIVGMAAEKFHLVGIITNGTYLPTNAIEELSSFRKNLVWSISIDSHDPEYHDRFRNKKGCWEKTVENTKLLVKKGFLVRVAMAVTPQNIDHMEKVAKLCVDMGVKAFTYSPVLPFGRIESFTWDAIDLWKLASEEKKVRKKFKKIIPVVKLEHFGEDEFNLNCGAGWRSIVIDPEFKVRPCVVSDSEKDTMGVISPDDPKSFFKDIKEVTSFYANLHVPNKQICKDCKFLNFCTPCMLRARKIIKSDLIKLEECMWVNNIEKKFLKMFL